MAGVLKKLGDYEGAKEGYKKALEINKNHFGIKDVQYAITLRNLTLGLDILIFEISNNK